METKVKINKTKLMVMVREPAVTPQRERYQWMWGLQQRHWSKINMVSKLWCHQKCLGLGNLRTAGDNYRCPTCVRGVVAVHQRLKVREDNLEIVDSLNCYLGDKIKG